MIRYYNLKQFDYAKLINDLYILQVYSIDFFYYFIQEIFACKPRMLESFELENLEFLDHS